MSSISGVAGRSLPRRGACRGQPAGPLNTVLELACPACHAAIYDEMTRLTALTKIMSGWRASGTGLGLPS